jgi:hypothetical protein
MLGSIGWACYPTLIIPTADPANSLTITNGTAGAYGLQAGVVRFFIGSSLIIIYTVVVHRAFRGPVRPDHDSFSCQAPERSMKPLGHATEGAFLPQKPHPPATSSRTC